MKIVQIEEKQAEGLRAVFAPSRKGIHGQPRMKPGRLFGKRGKPGARSGNKPVHMMGGIVLMHPPEPEPTLQPVVPPPSEVKAPVVPDNFQHQVMTERFILKYSVGLLTGRGSVTLTPRGHCGRGQCFVALERDCEGRWLADSGARHKALEQAIAAATNK